MNLKEKKLEDLAGSIVSAINYAPDEFPSWRSYVSWTQDIMDLWPEIKVNLKRDLEKAEWVEHKIKDMLIAFNTGDKALGKKIALEIYNSQIEKLR